MECGKNSILRNLQSVPERLNSFMERKGGEQVMTNAKRIGALALCIGLALVLAVSTAFVVHEADHVCSGDDCPVCQTIAANIRLLCSLGLALLVLMSLFFLPSGHSVHTGRNRYGCCFFRTLVSLKIRLNN